MRNYKFLKQNVNTDYFKLPCNLLKSKITSMKYHMNNMVITPGGSELFLCNKTSQFDEMFLSKSIDGDYVVMKDEIIQSIYDNTITPQEQSEILKEVSTLKNLQISIVVFPEKHKTVFGEFAKPGSEVIDFLLSMNMNIRFINIIGSYFLNPVWTNKITVCDTKLECKFAITMSDREYLSKQDLIEKINKYMPSSAGVYAKKFPIYMRSNNCAEYLERIIYFCPHCTHLFSLYSEFNCVKCRNCGTAFEISRINAEIGLTNRFSSLDEAKDFQRELLGKVIFDKQTPIISYNHIKFTDSQNEKAQSAYVDFSVYKEKIEYSLNGNTTSISFMDIYEAYLSDNNTLFITSIDLKEDKINYLTFRGEGRENLYILVDLFDIFLKSHNLT